MVTAPSLDSLRDARRRAERLFERVSEDALYDRSIGERHRLVFYIGHLEAFDWNLIGAGHFRLPPIHPAFDRLFAFGIDPPPGQLPCDQPSDWPALNAIAEYGARIREAVDRLWEETPAQLRHVAIEHRLMHVETLQYLLHALPLWKLRAERAEHPATASEATDELIRVESGKAVLGQPDSGAFGWDNEFAAHCVRVPAFAMDAHKTTNGQWLAFMSETGADAPNFWRRREGEWRLRTLFEEIALPLDWPVYVTHTQAAAYAAWRGMALPSEAQWHLAVDALPPDAEPNLGFRRWDPEPVGRGHQLTGNGWEWTATLFAPFEGFTPFPFYRGYSADFFDGAHYVLKGASPATAAQLARPSFRNWFRPDYPHLYAGFRCVASL